MIQIYEAVRSNCGGKNLAVLSSLPQLDLLGQYCHEVIFVNGHGVRPTIGNGIIGRTGAWENMAGGPNAKSM